MEFVTDTMSGSLETAIADCHKTISVVAGGQLPRPALIRASLVNELPEPRGDRLGSDGLPSANASALRRAVTLCGPFAMRPGSKWRAANRAVDEHCSYVRSRSEYARFDPSIMRIVRKYAVPAFATGSAIPAAMGGSQDSQ
jgi:hypothetical protein